MANAQLYLGDVLIGGEVSAQELSDLKDEVDLNTADIKELNDTTIPAINQDIADLNSDLNTIQGQVDGNSNAIDILANATVTAKFKLTTSSPVGVTEAWVEGGGDWTGASLVQLAKSDLAGSVFSYAEVNIGDILQIGSNNGKGLFEVTGIDNANAGYAEFTVTALVTSSGHSDGETVGVTIGSPYDEQEMKLLIAQNGAAISANESDIRQLETDVSNAQATADAAFPQGGTMRTYNSAYALEEAVLDNESAIASLTSGGDPDTDMLKAEAVLNANMKGANPGDPKAGVATIEVVNSLPGITVPTTLYVVV
jgi:hypothetical protein